MRSRIRSINLLVFAIIILQLQTGYALAQERQERAQKAREYFLAGKELIRQGNYAAADSEFKKAQQLLQDALLPVVSAKAEPKPAVVREEAEKPKETKEIHKLTEDPISDYLGAIRINPKNPDLHYNLACEYIKTNEYKLAEEEFKRALQLNHRDKDACYNLGVLYENYLDDRNMAVYYYGRYIGLAPRADDVWRVRVWVNDLKKQIANEK